MEIPDHQDRHLPTHLASPYLSSLVYHPPSSLSDRLGFYRLPFSLPFDDRRLFCRGLSGRPEVRRPFCPDFSLYLCSFLCCHLSHRSLDSCDVPPDPGG